LRESESRILNKKKKLGVFGWRTYKVPNNIQLRRSAKAFTLGGGIDGQIYETTLIAIRACST